MLDPDHGLMNPDRNTSFYLLFIFNFMASSYRSHSSLSLFRSRLKGGVVHSFDGSAEERDQILALGRYGSAQLCVILI